MKTDGLSYVYRFFCKHCKMEKLGALTRLTFDWVMRKMTYEHKCKDCGKYTWTDYKMPGE